MYNNPYFMSGINYPQSYPQFPQEKQQPITQNFQLANPMTSNEYFMAKILQPNQSAETEIVTQKTALIDLNNKKLSIKELSGDITTYEIVLPLDEKDKKIIMLENEINKLKEAMNNDVSISTNATIPTNETNTESTELNTSIKKLNRK